MKLYNDDCLNVLKTLDENSVDSVVCDPPYGLNFMGKHWDKGVPDAFVWEQVYRVMKPGAHLLSFGGTRTYHRMACAIEDAGFEIRDCIMWVYGSGFPKSMDVSKAIDKAGGGSVMHIDAQRAFANAQRAFAKEIRSKREQRGVSRKELASWFPQYAEVTKNWERLDDGFRVPTERDYEILVERLGIADDWREQVRAEDKRIAMSKGQDRRGDGTVYGLGHPGKEYQATTNLAKQWEGWGTALKPACEPIVVARKPLSEKTVAANVLKWGTGALNIDASRVGTGDDRIAGGKSGSKPGLYEDGFHSERMARPTGGRWPANLIHDGSDEVVELFPDRKTNDSGSAARFFYCAKASKKERGEFNTHPTVKPIALMKYLVTMVTPPGGTVLDPFMGSGTTGLACGDQFEFIGIELEKDHYEIALKRFGQNETVDEVEDDKKEVTLDDFQV